MTVCLLVVTVELTRKIRALKYPFDYNEEERTPDYWNTAGHQ